MIGFFEILQRILTESKHDDIDILKTQINNLFDVSIKVLIGSGKINKKDHVVQAEKALEEGYNWWGFLLKTMRTYPYKGQDLYDAATNLASDLWETVFNPNKYDDRSPPLFVFHKMARLRSQDIAFKFFGWRRKLKSTSMSDVQTKEPAAKGDLFSDIEWEELQEKLLSSLHQELKYEKNKDRAKRAIDLIGVKTKGYSELYRKKVSETGLDALSVFYHVNRREMYDTLLIVYRAIKEAAKDISLDLFNKVIEQLPDSLARDPEEVILSFIPSFPGEISHSDLFTKAYSNNRSLKALAFKDIIKKLLDKNQINTRKDHNRHQILYRLS